VLTVDQTYQHILMHTHLTLNTCKDTVENLPKMKKRNIWIMNEIHTT